MAKTKQKQDKLQFYLNRIRAAESQRDGNYRDLWARCYKRYRNKVDALKDKERSNISIPETFTMVETVVPRLVESLFANRPYVGFTSRQGGYDLNAKKMEVLVDWQMNERFDIRDKFHTGLKEMAIYGTTIAYSGWKYSERSIIKKQQMPVTVPNENGVEVPVPDEYGQPITTLKPVKQIQIEYDDPEVTFIDLGLFYVDPEAEDIDDARYCGHTCYASKDFIKNMEKMGIWSIDWKMLENSNMRNEQKTYRMSQAGLANVYSAVNSEDGLYRIDYYWEDDKYVVIINSCYVAKETENPFWHKRKPYVKDVYTRVPHEFYGMGIVEMLEDLQDELNTERNMRIDYRKFALRRMFKVRRGANINKGQLTWKQGGHIEVDEMDDVQEFRIDNAAGTSYTEEGTIKQDMRDASGAQDIIMGLSNSSETATTTMSKDNNASARFKLIISGAEKRLLVGIARLMSAMNQQLINDERMLRVTGETAFTTIQPEDIQGDFDYIAGGSSVESFANREAQKQRLVELYGLLVNDPVMQQFPDVKFKMLKTVVQSFGIKDVDNIFDSIKNGVPAMPTLPPQQPNGQNGPPININALGNGANTAIMEGQGLQNPQQSQGMGL